MLHPERHHSGLRIFFRRRNFYIRGPKDKRVRPPSRSPQRAPRPERQPHAATAHILKRMGACLKPRQLAHKPRFRSGAVPHPPSEPPFSVWGSAGTSVPTPRSLEPTAAGTNAAAAAARRRPPGRFDRSLPMPPLRLRSFGPAALSWTLRVTRTDLEEQRYRSPLVQRRVGNRPSAPQCRRDASNHDSLGGSRVASDLLPGLRKGCRERSGSRSPHRPSERLEATARPYVGCSLVPPGIALSIASLRVLEFLSVLVVLPSPIVVPRRTCRRPLAQAVLASAASVGRKVLSRSGASGVSSGCGKKTFPSREREITPISFMPQPTHPRCAGSESRRKRKCRRNCSASICRCLQRASAGAGGMPHTAEAVSARMSWRSYIHRHVGGPLDE